jgi:excisionase family DNA binding protein
MSALTTSEAAAKLGVSKRRVIALIETGKLPAERFGNAYVINEADLKLVEDRKPGRPPKSDKSKSKISSPPKKGKSK